MGKLETFLRARGTRVALAVCLLGTGAMGFAPYVLNDVSTQAAINAPLIRLTAAADGTVANLPVDGQYFNRPTSIRLLDIAQDTGEVADLSAREEIALAQINLSKRQLAELTAQETRLDHRAALFSRATSARLLQDRVAAQAAIESCQAERSEQAAALVRARQLAAQGFMSQAGVEKAMAAASAKESDCSKAAATLRSIQIASDAARSDVFVGDSYNDAPYAVQQADRVLLQRQTIEKTLSDATAEYAQTRVRLKDALARASYVAPAGTLVWAATSSSGASIRAGEPVIDLVDCRRRFVQVSLPERKAEVIQPGGQADIRMIGSSTWMKGRVVNITGGAGRRQERLLAASTYSQPGAREIIVDVALPAQLPAKVDASRKCDVGRLAEVRFGRSI